jgi:putative SOS response-associated peptidase YedK
MATTFHGFTLAGSIKRIQSRQPRVELPEQEEYVANYFIRPGDSTWVITGENPKLMQRFRFGLEGFCTVQPFLRAEGKRNSNDDPHYRGSNAIFLQPGMNRLIRSRRCLILADAFITGKPESPYLVYLLNKKRPFCFAGLWNHTIAEETGADVFSFAIITTVSNPFISSLGAVLMPVILEPNDELCWLKLSSQLSDILHLLGPYSENQMNAYPISPVTVDLRNDKSVIQPKGKTLFDESFHLDMRRTWRKKPSASSSTLADRIR